MPPPVLSGHLVDNLLNLSENSLIHLAGPLALVADLVPAPGCYPIANGILFAGFKRDTSAVARIRPIPVVTQILYAAPVPADLPALIALFVQTFAQAFQEWAQLHCSGQPYVVSQ
jgi:hypothetical protein